MNKLKSYIKRYWVYALALILFTLLSLPNSHLSGDDYCYSFVCSDGCNIFSLDGSPKTPMTGVGQIIPSQIYHYVYHNPRFLVHCLTQLYINFLGYFALTVTKVLLAFGAYWLLCRICIGGRRHHINDQITILALMIMILSYFSLGALFGNCALTFNYLLPVAATLLVLYLFVKYRRSDLAAWQNLLLFLVCVVAGALHEGFSIPLSGAFFFYALFRFKQLRPTVACLFVGYWIGSLTLLTSPSPYQRMYSGSGLIEKISTEILGYSDIYYVFIPLVILAGIMAYIYFVKGDKALIKRYIHDNAVYLLAVALCFVLCTIINPYYFNSSRNLMLVGVMLIILYYNLIKVVPALRSLRRYRDIIMICTVILTLYYWSNGMQRQQQRQDFLAQYTGSGDGLVHGDFDDSLLPVLPCYGFDIEGEVLPVWLPYKGLWQKAALEEYYSHSQKRMIFVPDLEADDLSPLNIIYQNDSVSVYSKPDSWYMIVRGLDIDTTGNESAHLDLDDSAINCCATDYEFNWANLPKKLFYKIVPRNPMSLFCTPIEHEGETMLLIYKRHDLKAKAININDMLDFDLP